MGIVDELGLGGLVLPAAPDALQQGKEVAMSADDFVGLGEEAAEVVGVVGILFGMGHDGEVKGGYAEVLAEAVGRFSTGFAGWEADLLKAVVNMVMRRLTDAFVEHKLGNLVALAECLVEVVHTDFAAGVGGEATEGVEYE